ncbi:MAG: amidohydrolase [Desulfobacteraceae bacterium]
MNTPCFFPGADLILTSAVIHTFDEKKPLAEAVAVSGERIAAVGSNDEIKALASPGTEEIDLGGKLVLPGFTDSHFHYYEWATNKNNINLAPARSFRDMASAVKTRAEISEKGEWILGQGFNESDWPENRIPDKNDLDCLAPDNPVCLWRCDLHLAAANSLALKRAGIHKNTLNPADGIIEKDKNGNPTGILRELAPNLIRAVIPEISEDKIIKNMTQGFTFLHSLGITGIHDIRLMGGMDGAASLRAWQKIREGNQCRVRCHVTLPGEMIDQALALGLRTGFGDDILKIGHLKFFADGGMGARTAWMNEKYRDAEFGMPLTPVNDLKSALDRADSAGLSLMIHAIGTRANREIIAMFHNNEKKQKSNTAIAHRIEHVQMIDPEDLEKLGCLNHVAVSCQPNNLSLDISMIEHCVGKRAAHTYRIKSIMDTGIPTLFSSDAPVCDPRPLAGIFSAVNRRRMDKTPDQGWYMNEAVSVDQAVRAYTINPAAATGVGTNLGSIERGKFADLTVLNRNIYDIDPLDIADVQADLTIFNGRIVYQRK